MLDKLILVFYVDVGNLPHDEAHRYIETIDNATTLSKEDQAQMIRYIIPIREGGSRVECLNPPSSCCCKNKTTDERINAVNDRLDRMDGIMFPITRKVILEKIDTN